MVKTRASNRKAVTLLEILVASIGAFGVLAGVAGLYMMSLILYQSAVRQDHRLASAGLVEDLMAQITTTCPTDRWRVMQGGPTGQDGFPQWRALTYDRLSGMGIRHPAATFNIRNPFDPFPPGSTYYPRNQNSVMNRETGVVYWWRDLNTWDDGQGRYRESKVYHLRLVRQARGGAAGPNQLVTVFGMGAPSFSDLSPATLGAFVNNPVNHRLSGVLADDVVEFHLELFPPAVTPPTGIYWRFDAYRGGT